MKVILLQDVAKIGGRFETVEVPTGFAQNKLIPKGQALPATPANEKRVAAQKAKQAAKREATAGTFDAAVEALGTEPLVVATSDANEQGHLYQALPAAAVVAAAAERGATLAQDQVVFPEPIKSLGEHEIRLVGGDEPATLTVSVVAAEHHVGGSR